MVRARHEEIQKIERDLIELSQMFNDLDALVVQQDAPVMEIERRGEEVSENVVKGNEEIKGAIDKARARNRKKWWCVLICSKSYPKLPQSSSPPSLTSIMQSLSSSSLSLWLSSPYSSPKSEIIHRPPPSYFYILSLLHLVFP